MNISDSVRSETVCGKNRRGNNNKKKTIDNCWEKIHSKTKKKKNKTRFYDR